MSSSNRALIPGDAAIYRNNHPIGPIRLPRKEPQSFVEQFNRLYQGTGIEIILVETPEPPHDDTKAKQDSDIVK